MPLAAATQLALFESARRWALVELREPPMQPETCPVLDGRIRRRQGVTPAGQKPRAQ